MIGTTSNTGPMKAPTAEELIAAMKKMMAISEDCSFASFMRERGYPPEEYDLFIPACEAEKHPNRYLPPYVRVSRMLDRGNVVFIRKQKELFP